MGKIKSKLIRRTGNILLTKEFEFSKDFSQNKKVLGNNTIPSKKIRNQIAGYLTRVKKVEEKKLQKLKK